MWKVKVCKAVAGEHVTTQHKLVVFVVWMKKRREVKSRGWKSIGWGKWRRNVVIEYKERMRARNEKLSEEAEGLEEWKKYGEAFRGIIAVLCGRTSGKGASSRDRNQVWWTEEVAEAVGEKEVWKRIEKNKDGGRQPDVGLLHLYGEKTKAARRTVEQVRNDMKEVHNKLEEDGGRKMIYDCEDMRGGGGD